MSARVFFAPARVNLIGEHIDYSGGDVLPAALTMGTWVRLTPNHTNVLRVTAEDLPGVTVACPIDRLDLFRGKGWGAYQLGVAALLRDFGLALSGCDLHFWGNIPFGAGLSSSASIEVATAFALASVFGTEPIDLPALAVLSQRVENEFVGVSCGIMDQYASACGKRDHAMLLSCDTLACRYVPLDFTGYRLILTNTNKKRSLADSKYNERRAESEAAFARLRTVYPDKHNLCEITPDELSAAAHLFQNAPIPFARAEHAVSEQARVHAAAEALSSGRLARFGRLLHESNTSLRERYEVTGKHLDALYDAICKAPGVLGSRMTGAGFGGCNVSLVAADAAEEFCTVVSRRYEKKTGLVPSFYFSEIGAGAHEVTEEELV